MCVLSWVIITSWRSFVELKSYNFSRIKYVIKIRYEIVIESRHATRGKNKRIGCRTHSKPTVNRRRLPIRGMFAIPGELPPWKRSHPGGGLYSNREGESRPHRGATSSRNKYVSPSIGPYILVCISARAACSRVETGLPAATNTSAPN